jgi:hypothetical protein
VEEQLVEDLRRRTRAAQHVSSYPLLAIGVLLLNYGVVGFSGRPIDWRYAAALVFVALWALGKAGETTTGLGAPRGDYLVAAAGVFALTQLTLMTPVVNWLGFFRLQGVWVAIVGLGLLAVARARGERRLLSWALLVCITGVAVAIANYSHWASVTSGRVVVHLGNQNVPVALLGLLLTIAGVVAYERERREV